MPSMVVTERMDRIARSGRDCGLEVGPKECASSGEGGIRLVEDAGEGLEDVGDPRGDIEGYLDVGRTRAGRVIAEIIGESQLDPDLAAAFRARYSGPRRRLAVEAMQRARSRGQSRDDVDTDAVVDQLWGACYHRVLMHDLPLTDEFARTLIRQLMPGLRPPPPDAPARPSPMTF